MIFNKDSIRTDPNGKEMLEPGMQPLGLSAHDGDIHQFVAGTIVSHWHRELEVFVLLEGRVELGIEDQIYALGTGGGCLVNTGALHSFRASAPSPCRFRSIVFDSNIVGGAPGSVFDTAYVRPLLEDGPPVLLFGPDDLQGLQAFGRAFDACAGEPPGYEFAVRAALSELLLFAKEKSRVVPARKMPPQQEDRVKQMLAYIDANSSLALSVKDIAAQANICPRECQRIFRRYLHCAPMVYVQRRRIFAAAEQLAGTSRPVTDIALSCGFSSPSYFSKQFKALVGSTPLRYRAAAHGAYPKAPNHEGKS